MRLMEVIAGVGRLDMRPRVAHRFVLDRIEAYDLSPISAMASSRWRSRYDERPDAGISNRDAQ
jgi:hypothetical protein